MQMTCKSQQSVQETEATPYVTADVTFPRVSDQIKANQADVNKRPMRTGWPFLPQPAQWEGKRSKTERQTPATTVGRHSNIYTCGPVSLRPGGRDGDMVVDQSKQEVSAGLTQI